MQFLYPSLTLGFLLVLLPLLIQLINLMRQRRVKWAAMEFLLQSYRKHRKWVWLKQFLLLLLRMLAIAAAVAMLAHLVTRDQLPRFLGGSTTHHIVLLDDSYSMADQSGSRSAFDRANQVLTQLASRAMSQDSLQKFTVLRFSQAARTRTSMSAGSGSQTDDAVPGEQLDGVLGQIADVNAVRVDTDFDLLLEDRRRAVGVSQLAVGPTSALTLSAHIIEQSPDERSEVYLVSDFRSAQWTSPTEARAAISRLEESGAQVHLVQCVEREHTNLAIMQLRPADGIRAAGVPLFIDVSVRNFGEQEARQVALTLQSTYFGKDRDVDNPADRLGEVNDLPHLLIDQIAAGETVTRRVQVFFPTAGQHVVTAELPADAVETDNRRWCVVDFPDAVPVLVVDGDPQQRNATYLNSVFQPGQRVQTGIHPTVQSPAFLRDARPEVLAAFRAIYLLDLPRLDALARQNIENYVAAGGGVGIFLGPNSELDEFRQWSAEGGGFFPVPTDQFALLTPSDGGDPDLIVSDHPIFRVLLKEGQVFAGAIRFQQYVRPAREWTPAESPATRVIATLRNGDPLAVEKSVGDGRVVVFLSTIAPTWNNWAAQPTFPVMVLETQSYLDAGLAPIASPVVGSPIEIQLETDRYQPQVDFLLPGQEPGRLRRITQQAHAPRASDSPLFRVDLGGDDLVGRTDRAGIYEAWPRTLDGEFEVRRFALNVDPQEGDLALSTSEELAESLAATQVELLSADDMTLAGDEPKRFSWSQFLLGALVVMLLIEQCLAYSASFHPSPGVAS